MASRSIDNTRPPRAGRGRPAKGERDGRRALLEAATRAFARQGFARADLRSIAAAAHVSPNLVRVHFGSKAALWDACLDEMIRRLIPVVAEVAVLSRDRARPVGERLSEAIGRIAAVYAEHPDVRSFVSLSALEAPERAERLTRDLLQPAYEAVQPLLEQALASGVVVAGHPAILFALINTAVSPPATFPTVLKQIAPDIDVTTARHSLVETFTSILLHQGEQAPRGDKD